MQLYKNIPTIQRTWEIMLLLYNKKKGNVLSYGKNHIPYI